MNELASMREQVYADPRPKEHFDRFHERARTREPDSVYEVTRILTSLYAYTLLRTRAISPEHVPASGPVILAPNHFSFMDHFLVGCYLRRKIRFMAKSSCSSRRRSGSTPTAACSRCAEARATRKPSSQPRACSPGGPPCRCTRREAARGPGRYPHRPSAGIGRLALETGVPVVPIAVFGSSRVRNWKRLQFPKVTVQYAEPMVWEQVADPTRDQQQAVADEVLDVIRVMYAGLQEKGRKGVLRGVREQRRSARRSRRRAGSAAAA